MAQHMTLTSVNPFRGLRAILAGMPVMAAAGMYATPASAHQLHPAMPQVMNFKTAHPSATVQIVHQPRNLRAFFGMKHDMTGMGFASPANIHRITLSHQIHGSGLANQQTAVISNPNQTVAHFYDAQTGMLVFLRADGRVIGDNGHFLKNATVSGMPNVDAAVSGTGGWHNRHMEFVTDANGVISGHAFLDGDNNSLSMGGQHHSSKSKAGPQTFTAAQFDSAVCSTSGACGAEVLQGLKVGVPTKVTLGVKAGILGSADASGITTQVKLTLNPNGTVTVDNPSAARAISSVINGTSNLPDSSGGYHVVVNGSTNALGQFFANDGTGVGRIQAVTPQDGTVLVSLTAANGAKGQKQVLAYVTNNDNGTYTIQGTQATPLKEIVNVTGLNKASCACAMVTVPDHKGHKVVIAIDEHHRVRSEYSSFTTTTTTTTEQQTYIQAATRVYNNFLSNNIDTSAVFINGGVVMATVTPPAPPTVQIVPGPGPLPPVVAAATPIAPKKHVGAGVFKVAPEECDKCCDETLAALKDLHADNLVSEANQQKLIAENAQLHADNLDIEKALAANTAVIAKHNSLDSQIIANQQEILASQHKNIFARMWDYFFGEDASAATKTARIQPLALSTAPTAVAVNNPGKSKDPFYRQDEVRAALNHATPDNSLIAPTVSEAKSAPVPVQDVFTAAKTAFVSWKSDPAADQTAKLNRTFSEISASIMTGQVDAKQGFLATVFMLDQATQHNAIIVPRTDLAHAINVEGIKEEAIRSLAKTLRNALVMQAAIA